MLVGVSPRFVVSSRPSCKGGKKRTRRKISDIDKNITTIGTYMDREVTKCKLRHTSGYLPSCQPFANKLIKTSLFHSLSLRSPARTGFHPST